MNKSFSEAEARLQAQAELAERNGLPPGAPAVDAYRVVVRALRQPPEQQLPAGFAAQVAARVGLAEQDSSLEDWLMSLMLLGVGITGLVYMQPLMADMAELLSIQMPRLPELPWPLLVATGAGMAIAWALDRGVINWQRLSATGPASPGRGS